MTVTVGRVLGLTAVTVALAAAVGLTGDRAAPPARPLAVPGLAVEQLDGLELARGADPPVVVALDGTPRLTAPVPAAADERAVRDLLSTVAAARFDRLTAARAGDAAWRRAGLDTPRATLRLRRGDATTELRVGADVDASGQAWLAVDRRLGLVPGWVAAALVREPDSLRDRRPFPASTTVTAVELHAPDLDLVLAGAPLARRDPGTAVQLEPVLRARLLERLTDVTVDVPLAEPPAPPPGTPAVTVRVLGGAAPAELTTTGPCPGHPPLRAVATSVGAGCVDAAAIDALVEVAGLLAADDAIAAAPVDRFDRTSVAALELGGEPPVRLEPDGAGWRLVVGDRPRAVDGALARDLAAALTAPATREPATARPPRASERWQLRRPTGDVESWEVERTPARVSLRREREPVRLVLAPDAAAAVRLAGHDLRDRTLLSVDPFALAAIDATGAAPASVRRGALVDEWLVTAPAGASPAPAALAALRDRLAALRATGWLPAGGLGPVRRTVRLTLDPAPGDRAPRLHTVEVGAPRGDGCPARVDGGDVARLAAADCAALLAPLVNRAR